MMASLRVKSVQNLEQVRGGWLGNGNAQSSRPKRMGFVNYNHRHNQLCQAPCLRVRAAVVNTTSNDYRTDSCSSNSRICLFDDHGSQLGSSSSSSGPNGIYSEKRRMVDKEEDFSGKLDKWVKDSVAEIVNNLDEAPFLVHIYPDGEEASASTGKARLVSEKAAAESWPIIKRRWGGESPAPSGIILVEEMKSSEEAGSDGEKLEGSGSGNRSCTSSTKVWGILIQGKGLSCPACYILKTSRVRSMSGCCTHFCLVKVKCFFETVDTQLKKLWLV